MTAITLASPNNPIPTILGHLNGLAGTMRSLRVGASDNQFPYVHELATKCMQYGFYAPDFESLSSEADIAAFKAKVLEGLKPAMSENILAQASSITARMVRESRESFGYVPSFVRMGLITQEAGDVLMRGAQEFFPHLYEADGMLGTHIKRLVEYFNSSHINVFWAEEAFETFGFGEKFRALVARNGAVRCGDIPELVEKIEARVSRVVLRHRNFHALAVRYGLDHDVLTSAAIYDLMSFELADRFIEVIDGFEAYRTTERMLKRHIVIGGVGALLAAGLMTGAGWNVFNGGDMALAKFLGMLGSIIAGFTGLHLFLTRSNIDVRDVYSTLREDGGTKSASPEVRKETA